MKKLIKSSEIIKARQDYGRESAKRIEAVSFEPVIKLILNHYNQGDKMKKVTVNKAALNEINYFQFGFYWFGFAIIWNLIYSGLRGQFKTIKTPTTFQLKHLLGIGFTEVVATTTIFIGIMMISNPSIPALIRNLEPVLIVFLAIIFLKEK